MTNQYLVSASNSQPPDIRTALLDVCRLISVQLVMDEGLFVKIEQDSPKIARGWVRSFMDFVSERIDIDEYVIVDEFVEINELKEDDEGREMEEEEFEPLESLAWNGGCDDPDCGCVKEGGH